ncbi:hypothetical protein N8569_00215 [bacterium]|jgi:hypothetical protein|nr:hypothetical protein [bacterium]
MPNITKKVVDITEDILEDTAEKLEDGLEFLMRPEVILCILSLIILVCILMYFMKKEDSIESYKYR